MDNNNGDKAASGGGVGLTGILTIVFIVLKLCHVIDWSWFWVLSPVIFSVALVVILIVIFLILGIIASKV